MKIKSPYRRPSRRISPRSNEGPFFQTGSSREAFFTPGGDVQAKSGEEEIPVMAKETEEEEPIQAKEEEEEVQAKEEDEEQIQAKEQEEEEPAQAKRMPQETFQAKCHCGGTCGSCSGGRKGERREKYLPKVEMIPPTGTAPGKQAPQPTLKFGTCSPQEETIIRYAISQAGVLAKKALGFLGPLIAKGPGAVSPHQLNWYESWFGAYDPMRAGFVLASFATIKNHLDSGTITFHCDPNCDPKGKSPTDGENEDDPGGNGTLVMDLTAYVFKGAPVEIFLCPPFWKTKSKGGIIVHELAHEASNQINDLAYGAGACQQLALSNPGGATRNADNYQFFAETLP